MGNLSCGNLDPPPYSGGQSAASSPSALHEDGLTKRFRRCRSPFREPPKSDRHHLGTLIAIARNTQAFEAGKPAMIIDAKYSDTEQPAAGDLYQLLCYVRRLKADIGVLVRSEEPSC